MTACYKNHPSVVSRLLTRADVDPNWRSEEGDSLMMTCCARSYNSIIQLLVSRPDLDINYTGQRWDTSLDTCLDVRVSHKSVLYRDLSPLMLACIEGNATGVSTILARHDVNVNIIGKDGVTAISLACLQGNMEIVQMLLACREVNINKMTVDGVTPFTVSIFKVNEEQAPMRAFSEYCEINHREMSLTPSTPTPGPHGDHEPAAGPARAGAGARPLLRHRGGPGGGGGGRLETHHRRDRSPARGRRQGAGGGGQEADQV